MPPNMKKQAKQQSRKNGGNGNSSTTVGLVPEWEERLRTMASRASRTRCMVPIFMRCPALHCDVEFSGGDAWDQRMEHVARHLERAAAHEEPRVEFGGADDTTLIDWASRPDVAVIRWNAGRWELNNPLRQLGQDSPAISQLQGTARTRGMRGAANVATQRMANLGRSETPEAVQDFDQDSDQNSDQDTKELTDSGYASALYKPNTRTVLAADNEGEKHGSQKNADDLDGKTIYTSQMTVATGSAQQCILDVCNDMHGKLLTQLGDKTGAIVRSRLPALLRAFAINLGMDTSNELNAEVMPFIHKYYR